MTRVPFTVRGTGRDYLRSCEVINSFWPINHEMIVLKTCKWHQTDCLVMTRQLVPSMTFLGQLFKLTYLGHYIPCYFVMISGDLNIDLTRKSCLHKLQVFKRAIKRRLPFVVMIRVLKDLKGAKRPPARFRAFQSPPGIGFKSA